MIGDESGVPREPTYAIASYDTEREALLKKGSYVPVIFKISPVLKLPAGATYLRLVWYLDKTSELKGPPENLMSD